MSKQLVLLVFIIIFNSSLVQAGPEIVVLQSLQVKPYEEALNGFRQACNCQTRKLVLTHMRGSDVVKKINCISPEVVLALGMQGLSEARKIQDIPVVYLMVLNPQVILSGEQNITGVSMHIPPDKQINALLEALPSVTNIGLLYDPSKTGPFIHAAQHAATKIGVNLITGQIRDPRQAPDLILDMKQKIDVFWMLPDVTVVTPETVEFLLLFSFENKIPIFTFSEKYVAMGAFMSMDIDAFDMGRQAGEMAESILAGADVKKLQPAYAAKAVVSTNVMIARKLGIRLTIAMTSGVKINDKVFRKIQTIK